MKRSRLLPVLLSLALVATLPSACARPFGKSDKSPHAAAATFSASKAISSSPASKAGNASLSIQEVETKLLRFATSLQKPGDMDYKQLEEMLSIRFDPPKDLAVSRRVLKSLFSSAWLHAVCIA